jgi:hypothetical protein
MPNNIPKTVKLANIYTKSVKNDQTFEDMVNMDILNKPEIL